MGEPKILDNVRDGARAAFQDFMDSLIPFRPELHRYCRRLTANIWEAEDLVQDTLLKAFASLGLEQGPVANPRGYVVRMATNIWIDGQRRAAVESEILASEAVLAGSATQAPADRRGLRAAAGRLMAELAPRERAAVILKDVFDMSLREISEVLASSENAVKAALHRGRTRLSAPPVATKRAASPALIEAFVSRLDAADLPGLLALMLDTATIELPPMLMEVGRAQFERKGSWLWQSVNVHPELPADLRPPKWMNRVTSFHGETIVLGLMPPSHGGTLQGVNRFEEEDGKISRIRSYCFSPETIAEVAAELGLMAGPIPYRFPTPAPSKGW